MPEEKIIAVIGAPRSGKTFLVNKLASVLGAQAFLEGYGDKFPKFIEDDIKNSENNLRRILWFRNRQISHLLEAVKLKKIQKGVVLDTFWVDNQMYVDVLLSGHDKDVVNELIEKNLQNLGAGILIWMIPIKTLLRCCSKNMKKYLLLFHQLQS